MMKKPSLESLGQDLLHTTVGERVRCLTLPFATCAGFFAAGHAGWWWVAAICAVLQAFFTYPQVPRQRWPELAKRLDPYFAAQGLQPIVLWR